jgi:hypothetical protein
MLRLSVTGVPNAWDSGGRLETSLIEWVLSAARLATEADRSAVPLLLLSQRCLLTELRLREARRELKCIHPLRNQLGFLLL